jgi:hypothetical protein
MKIQIENLNAQMRGVKLTLHQRADALIEFNKLVEYTESLESKVEKLPLVSIIESIYSEIETRILEARKDECWDEVDIADKYGVIDGLKQAKFIVDEHKSKYSL